MTVTEMITRFEKHMKELVEEIRELDTTLTAKKEEFFRLQGAIEGLKMAKEQEDGDLIVFPSFIWHQINPNKSDVERFVTAGNIAFIHIDFHSIGLKDYQ